MQKDTGAKIFFRCCFQAFLACINRLKVNRPPKNGVSAKFTNDHLPKKQAKFVLGSIEMHKENSLTFAAL